MDKLPNVYSLPTINKRRRPFFFQLDIQSQLGKGITIFQNLFDNHLIIMDRYIGKLVVSKNLAVLILIYPGP